MGGECGVHGASVVIQSLVYKLRFMYYKLSLNVLSRVQYILVTAECCRNQITVNWIKKLMDLNVITLFL